GGKRLESEERIHADAENLSFRLVQAGQAVAERAQLLGTDRAERRRKKRQHDRPALEVAERHRLPFLVHQGKIGRLSAFHYSHLMLLPTHLTVVSVSIFV